MTWSVIVDTKAHKQLRKIPRAQNERILVALETLASNPYSGDIEKIAGEKDVWRRRVGDYRIFYALNPRQRTINVFGVKRRTSTTY